MLISSFLTNPRWNFSKALEIMKQTPVLEGLWKGTIVGTIGSMAIGIVGGVIIAVLRLSHNPVLRGVSFVYTWFFRGIPRLVLLAMIGSGVGFLYNKLDFGVPFGQQLASFMGLSSDFTFFTLNVNQFSSTPARRHHRPRPLRGGLHGRDRPGRHPVGRPAARPRRRRRSA